MIRHVIMNIVHWKSLRKLRVLGPMLARLVTYLAFTFFRLARKRAVNYGHTV